MYSGTIDDIHFMAGGWPLDSDKLTLVFIHGSGGDWELWRSQVEALADSVNTVALDLPGHGGSPGPGSASIPTYAGKVMEFIRAAGISQPVPCGLSIGGGIVLQMLLDFPGELSGGILVSTGARLRVAAQIIESAENDYPTFLKTLAGVAASPKTPEEQLAPFFTAATRTAPEVTAGDFRACDGFDVIDRLGEINLPVLVISAEEDQLTPPKYGDFLENRITGAKRAHIQDAGHVVPLEQPEEVNSALSEFLLAL